MKEIIDRTQKFLYEHLCESGFGENEIKYRYDHSLRVTNIGLALCDEENGDKKIIAIGCLLHDVGKFDAKEEREHGRVSAVVAREFLETLGLSKKEIDDICYAIAVHVDGKCGYEYEETLESKIVSDSDNIDRFGANRIQQMTIWEQKDGEKSINEKIESVEKLLEKLNRYYNGNILETESGNKKFKEQLELQIHFYNKYLDELKITKVPAL